MAYNKTNTENAQAEEKKKPVNTIRAGNVTATIWENKGNGKDGNDFSFFTTAIERNYMDEKTKTWKKTSSFRTMDLPKVELVSRKAYENLSIKEKSTE